MTQDGPKMAPRWPQDGSKMAQDGLKSAREGVEKPNRGPKMAPRWPRTAPRGSKMATKRPKMAPRWPKMAPRWLQIGPRLLSNSLKTIGKINMVASWLLWFGTFYHLGVWPFIANDRHPPRLSAQRRVDGLRAYPCGCPKRARNVEH